MRLSLIVCTRNRAEQLEQALRAYAAVQCASEWQLVLVDNGSTDGTADILADFAARSSIPVEIAKEPLPGLSRARNRGLSVAVGEIVAFTDDDCYPRGDFATAILRRFEESRVTFLGGRVLLHDESDLPITIQELNEEVVLPAGSYIPPGLIHGANMAFRRDIILSLGGFDERLGAGAAFKSGEDSDALIRCSTAGHDGVYDPAVVVSHHHGRKTDEQARALQDGYAVGRGACMLKHSLDPNARPVYLRKWYWRLREASWRSRGQELWAALRFFAHSRFSSRRVLSHPHKSLGA